MGAVSAKERTARLINKLRAAVFLEQDGQGRLTDALTRDLIQKEIEEYGNEAFKERDMVLAGMAKMAQLLGYKCGLGLHDLEKDPTWDPQWRYIVFIELPNINDMGPAVQQISWHIHDSELHMFSFLGEYDATWDGHTTEQKYARLIWYTKNAEVG